MDVWVWWLVALAGVLMPVQPLLNAWAAQALGSPWWAACLSFATGLAVLLPLALALGGPLPWKAAGDVPLAVLWAGPLGVLFVTVTLVAVPRLGVFPVMVLLVAAQLAAALAMDHFGWFGVPRAPLSPWRLAGAALVVAGVVLARKP